MTNDFNLKTLLSPLLLSYFPETE